MQKYFSKLSVYNLAVLKHVITSAVILGQNFFYWFIYKPSYCNFQESRKKNKIQFLKKIHIIRRL